MKKDTFDRTTAFSMKIKDSEIFEDKSAIIQMLSLNNECLIFKSSGIYRLLTADDIDPQNKYPETRHSYEKLYSIGASNSYVARMILQFEEILGLTIQDIKFRERLLNHVWTSNKILLEVESSYYSIYKQVIDLLPKCDEIIELYKSKSGIPALPKVENLKTYIEDFFNNAKLFLISSYEVLHILYEMPFFMMLIANG